MWHRCKNNCAFLPSRLARALWIEALCVNHQAKSINVEARESLVDRSLRTPDSRLSRLPSRLARALWIEACLPAMMSYSVTSRLARALWIEVNKRAFLPYQWGVEARESLVDRSFSETKHVPSFFKSRLARALWIEVDKGWNIGCAKIVEARESLVDRSDS